jgi:hypothetical protein
MLGPIGSAALGPNKTAKQWVTDGFETHLRSEGASPYQRELIPRLPKKVIRRRLFLTVYRNRFT